ncbi:Tn3 family transposase [Morganella morganii]|nr:Tn3 family transposase [Morganella morganii]MCU6237393.1 Tn3 family transposase [Morganella morganii]HCR3556116.1 Tn3 family transposase [Morganella morganii]HCR3761327.1 Tn3 family transposase [Morganella morganii]HCT5325928.1 Tn3 family transposase [Morganella morganii]
MDGGLQSIISSTSLNLKEIETHWHEVLRLASSIKQGTIAACGGAKTR